MRPKDLQERLSQLVGGSSANAFAKKCGLPESLVRKYLKGESLPGYEKIFQLAEGAGVRPEWLLTGEEPMRPGEGVTALAAAGPHEIAAPAGAEGYTYIARVDVRASAGDEILIPAEEVVTKVALHDEYVRELRLDPKLLVEITAKGDSMEPGIRDGDVLVVDLRRAYEKTDGIYVLNVDGQVLVKRLQFRLDGTIVIISDNPAYPPQTLRPGEGTNLRIAGRVVWSGSRV